MIFVTVGTQKFEFNRLLIKLDELIEDGTIKDEVFAQIGVCSYKPKHYQYKTFMPKDIMMEWLMKADMVVTHAGTGIMMTAIRMGKKVIAVPRLREFNEHVDDHQFEIVKVLGGAGIIEPVYEMDKLGACIERARTHDYRPYISTRQQVVEQLDTWICEYREAETNR